MADTRPRPGTPARGAVEAPPAGAVEAPPAGAVDGPPPGSIDARGPRVAAGITCVVLAVAVATGSAWVLAVQVLAFAIGSVFGVRRTPHAWVYQRFVRPHLGPPTAFEDPAPPRFAQTVGLVITGAALVPALLGVQLAVGIGAGLAFVAAFLNASIDFCLGCRMYPLFTRARARVRTALRAG